MHFKTASSMTTKKSAWSLIELVTIISVLALLGTVLFPALARTGSNSHSFQCMNNLRQLMAAMLMYSHENHDLFPPNPDDGSILWCPGQAGVGSADEFNSDLLKDPSRSLLAPYIQKNVALFKCPTDSRSGRSTAPSSLGQTVPAARTISMNAAVGTDPYSPNAKLAVNGAWLDGNHTNTRNGPWATYGKTTDITLPSPSFLFVLLDEDPLSINDGSFAISMASSIMIDWPGTLHNFSGSFAYADGRSEIHKWKDKRTLLTSSPVSIVSMPGSPDIAWLQQRTSIHK